MLKIKTLDSESLEKLRTEHRGKEMITNIINYDILANPNYNNKFFYVTMDQRDQIGMESSDFVARALYLGEQKL